MLVVAVGATAKSYPQFPSNFLLDAFPIHCFILQASLSGVPEAVIPMANYG
jgi:hypothetical protein